MFKTMATFTLILMLFFGAAKWGDAQAMPVPFEKDGKWGYQDTQGNVVIAPRYLLAYEFTEGGIAAVLEASGWVYIDRAGKKIIKPFVFDNGPDYFADGLARFVENGKYGFFDTSGHIAIKAQFDFASSFSEGLAAVCRGCRKIRDGEHSFMKGGLWGYINRQGDMVIPFRFENAGPFENGAAAVEKMGDRLMINRKGVAVPVNGHMGEKASTLKQEGVGAERVQSPGEVSRPLAYETQRINGNPEDTARYVRDCKESFGNCMRNVFLEIARFAFQEKSRGAETQMPHAMECLHDYWQSMKGGINLKEKDIRAALFAEVKLQERFYKALSVLCAKFQQHGQTLELVDVGDFRDVILWDMGLHAGCRIKAGKGIYLYGYPLVYAETDAYMIPTARPTAADVLIYGDSVMLFRDPSSTEPGETFVKAVEEILGTFEDLKSEISNVHTARLYSSHLYLSVIEEKSLTELEALARKYDRSVVIVGDPHTFKAAIHTFRTDLP